MKTKLSWEKITRAYDEVPRWDLLHRILITSLKHLGGFPDRYPRVFEYTWVLEHISGTDIVDVGAGVSPLPIVLAERGHNVTTIDYMPDQGNEWGFIDYRKFSPLLTSHNIDVTTYRGGPFDVVYSVSAIEHMPRVTRATFLEMAYDMLKPGGKLLVTTDLIKGTDNIWNKNLGQVIEENHGTVEDIEHELFRFDVVHLDRQTGIKGVGTDLLYIIAERCAE